MPISMGIICEECRIVYLVNAGANRHIKRLPRNAGPGMFTLTCFCGATRPFQKNDLKPYTVSTPVNTRGYAKGGEYTVQQDHARSPLRKSSPNG
jgi:hypothetical protein